MIFRLLSDGFLLEKWMKPDNLEMWLDIKASILGTVWVWEMLLLLNYGNSIRLESGRYWYFQSYWQMLITNQGNFNPVLISKTLKLPFFHHEDFNTSGLLYSGVKPILCSLWPALFYSHENPSAYKYASLSSAQGRNSTNQNHPGNRVNTFTHRKNIIVWNTIDNIYLYIGTCALCWTAVPQWAAALASCICS